MFVGGNVSFIVIYIFLQSESEKFNVDEWYFIIVVVIDNSLLYYIDGELLIVSSVILSGFLQDFIGVIMIGRNDVGKKIVKSMILSKLYCIRINSLVL